MTFYRGMDGSVTEAGTSVAQIESWQADVALEELDTTSMGDAWKSVVGGVGSWSGQFTAKIDLAAGSGQNALAASLITGTPAGTTVAVELRVTGTTKKITGNVLLKGFQVQQQLGQIVKATFSFTGSGAPTLAWT